MARRGNQTREGDDGGWNKEKDNIGLNDIGQGNVGLKDIGKDNDGVKDVGKDNDGLKDVGKDDLGQDRFWTTLNQVGQDLAGFVSLRFQ